MTHDWQQLKEHSSPLALNLIRWIALHLGRPFTRTLLFPISLYYLIFASHQRQASRQYLRRIFRKEPSLLQIAKHIFTFSSTILDRIYLLSGQFDKLDVDFPQINTVRHYTQNGRGSILLGSHLGSFEVLRSYAVKKFPLPIKILMDEGQTPMVMRMLNALNPSVAETIIPLTGGTTSLLEVRDAINQGCMVGMLGDRLSKTTEASITCTLLGAPVSIPAGPFLIAATLKTPLIVFFGLYLGGKQYEIHFELLDEEIRLSRNHRQQDLERYAQKYVDLIEHYLLKAPYNWFNFYDYWQEEHGQ